MPKAPDGSLTPGHISPLRHVPPAIARPEYVGRPAPKTYTGGNVRTEEEIDRIRVAGRIAADALEALHAFIRPGITTDAVDAFVHDFLVRAGAYPSTLGYRGFPKSCCTSLNEVVCHGIPDDTVIEEGDILNVDITAFYDGMHGDTNRTYAVGDISDERALLVERTEAAMLRGIKAAAPGREVNVIGRAIGSFAKRHGYDSVRDYTGHGVGPAFHTGLVIPHYDNPQFDDVIQDGMVFTVEPMLTLGPETNRVWDDGWTVVTVDGQATAQFEHTVVVRESGTEILTLPSAAEHA